LPATLDGLSTALTDYANGAGALGLIVKSDFLWYAYYSVIAMKGQVVYAFTAPYPGQIQLGRELESATVSSSNLP
jgi:hypothetical protein